MVSPYYPITAQNLYPAHAPCTAETAWEPWPKSSPNCHFSPADCHPQLGQINEFFSTECRHPNPQIYRRLLYTWVTEVAPRVKDLAGYEEEMLNMEAIIDCDECDGNVPFKSIARICCLCSRFECDKPECGGAEGGAEGGWLRLYHHEQPIGFDICPYCNGIGADNNQLIAAYLPEGSLYRDNFGQPPKGGAYMVHKMLLVKWLQYRAYAIKTAIGYGFLARIVPTPGSVICTQDLPPM